MCRRFHPLRAKGPRSKGGSREATPFLLDLPPDMNRPTARTDRAAFSPQRREPKTTPEGSFVRRRFHLAAGRRLALRKGSSREATCSFQTCSPDMNQRTARTDRGLSARSGACRRRRLRVRSCTADSTRCGPQARAPEGQFTGSTRSFRTCSPDINLRTAWPDRGLSARSGASRRRRLRVRSCAADSTPLRAKGPRSRGRSREATRSF